MIALLFNKRTSVFFSPFQLVHTDIWRPSSVDTKGGSLYYVPFVNDFSRFSWIYLMIGKSDFFKIYDFFHNMVQTEFSTIVKVLHSDLGGE